MPFPYLDPFEGEPDFVNETGTKWWKSHPYKGCNVWYIEMKNGERTIVASDGEELVAEDTTLDGLGCKIDVYNLLKKDTPDNPKPQEPA